MYFPIWSKSTVRKLNFASQGCVYTSSPRRYKDPGLRGWRKFGPVHTIPVRNSAGIKWIRFATVHTMHHAGSMLVSSLFVFSYLIFTLITVGNIYHSQNLSSNRNETTVTVKSCYVTKIRDRIWLRFKLLLLAFRFQTLTVSVMVSHFSWRYHVNAIPKHKNFVYRYRVNGFYGSGHYLRSGLGPKRK